jgi:hypothetical protein
MRTSAFSTSRRARTVSEPSLTQFVVLSMLLHILLVLLFGTAERGSGWRAQDLEATLAPFLPDSTYRVKVAPGAQAGGRESAPTPRPGAPREPSPTPSRRDVAPAPAVEPAPQTPQPTGASPLPEAPAIESLPSLDRGAPEIVDKAIELRREEALPRELLQETIPRVELEAPRELEQAITPAPPVAVPRQAPPIAPPPATPRARPAAEPEKAPVIETPSPVPEAPLAAPPKIERETPPAVEPETKLAPLSPVAPPPAIVPLEEQLPRFVPETPRPLLPETTAPALEAPPVLAPPVTTPAAPARAERPTPRPADQAPTAQPVPAAPATPQSASPESPRVDVERSRARDLEPARPATAPPRDAPAPEPSPRLKLGEDPDDIFKPRTSPPVGVVPPPGQAPRLNLEAAKREQGPEIGRSGGRKGIFNLDAPPPEPVSKLGKAIQKAAQPDCRDAYAAMGLLAVPFLMFDTITDTGCRWR